MANYAQVSHQSDDEEDLNSLRLAALQSLKQKALSNNSSAMTAGPLMQLPYSNNNRPNSNRSYRGFRGGGGRPPRGNSLHHRSRTNTNLISIQTVPDPEVTANQVIKEKETPKLMLPQDRYFNTKIETKPEEVNKFNRYDNSDESDSESDAENNSSASQPSSPGELKKADSLEQLMDELENEMVGETKDAAEVKSEPPKPKVKTKKVKKPKQLPSGAITSSKTPVISTETVQEDVSNQQLDINKRDIAEKNINIKENVTTAPIHLEEKSHVIPKTVLLDQPKSSLSNSPVNRRRSRSPLARNRSRSPLQSSPIYRIRSPRRSARYTPSPPHYDRPLSPLNLNTDVLNTIAMAPLSPRSAAFVLKNREILARRRKSPERRRSYSRSPTPPSRRYSPHRGFSNRDRSYSPPGRREQQRLKRKSHSPLAPKNAVHNRLGNRPYLSQPASKSDLMENLPKVSPRPRSRSSSLSLSPTPERDVKMPLVPQRSGRNAKERRNSPERKDVKKKDLQSPLDPVLEARRRKFETPVEVTTHSATVIRLKPSKVEEAYESGECEHEMEEDKDCFNVEENIGEDENEIEDEFVELTTKVDDIFSDEESDEENEGRFKSSGARSRNVTVLPFTKLANGASDRLKTAPLLQQNNRRGDRRDRDRGRNRRRSKSPQKTSRSDAKSVNESNLDPTVWNSVLDSYKEKPIIKEESVSRKPRITVDVNRSASEKKKSSNGVNLSSNENKKIEIKIRNPTKYESRRDSKEKTEQPDVSRKEDKNVRKVEVANKNVEKRPREETDDEPEPEIIVESEEDDSNTNEGGDLRAQLSRKRAERQNKSVKKVLPSRLLQSALQEVVSKVKKVKTLSKSTKPVPENVGKNGARRVQVLQTAPRLLIKITDSRKPIHMRLGVAAKSADSFEGGSSRKKSKSRKMKNRITAEQQV